MKLFYNILLKNETVYVAEMQLTLSFSDLSFPLPLSVATPSLPLARSLGEHFMACLITPVTTGISLARSRGEHFRARLVTPMTTGN